MCEVILAQVHGRYGEWLLFHDFIIFTHLIFFVSPAPEERLKNYCENNQIRLRRVVFEDHSAKIFNRWNYFRYCLKPGFSNSQFRCNNKPVRNFLMSILKQILILNNKIFLLHFLFILIRVSSPLQLSFESYKRISKRFCIFKGLTTACRKKNILI